MSTITDQLQRIETLRQQIAGHGKLTPETLKRIEYRFRLECNYHSNRQEGGTLTRQETRTVMTGNISVDKKPLKDILEMKGHDEAMTQILRIGRGEVNISEKRIQDIHREIIYEDDPKKQAMVGKWKTYDNEIINSKGEKYGFTPWDEVPEAMHQLLNWLNTELEKIKRNDKAALQPVIVAFDFHIRFLTIHPFHDGNGRTARLLSNLLLIAHGYPPFYITDEEKDTYNRYLTDIQGYGGSPDLFYEFMAGLVARSLQLTMDVIEGKDDDPDDWAKKLRLIKTTLPAEQQLFRIREESIVVDIIEKSIIPAIESLLNKLGAFEELFVEEGLWFGDSGHLDRIIEINNIWEMLERVEFKNEVVFKYEQKGFRKQLSQPFDIRVELRWQLDEYTYSFSISGQNDSPKLTHYYHEYYTSEDINTITSYCGNLLVKQIEENLKRINPK